MEKQKTFSKRKKVLMFCLISVFTLMCAGGGVVHWLNNERSSINATQNTDSTSYVMIDEIWNAEEGYFNGGALSSLLQYITGNEDINASDITTQGSIGQTKTSADIRDIQLNAGNTYQYTDEDTQETITTGKDVQVTFGGLTWTVVYLSQDANGNDIVTLWLSNNYQEAWEGRQANEGTLYGFVNGALYSDWSNDIYNNYYQINHPTNMYGTSYINAVTLNNGGSYVTSVSGTSSTSTATLTSNVGQNSNSVFAIYTMDSVAGSVTDYLVKPNEVSWQGTENAYAQGCSRTYGNDAWGTPAG